MTLFCAYLKSANPSLNETPRIFLLLIAKAFGNHRQRRWFSLYNKKRRIPTTLLSYSEVIDFKEALNNEVRADSRRFWLRRKFWKCGNTGCISHFQNCADGAKDSLFSRNQIVQSFLKFSLCFLFLLATDFLAEGTGRCPLRIDTADIRLYRTSYLPHPFVFSHRLVSGGRFPSFYCPVPLILSASSPCFPARNVLHHSNDGG